VRKKPGVAGLFLFRIFHGGVELKSPTMPEAILPDVLSPNLRLVFCGSAAGRRSAEAGAYYAHPGNMFWRVLHEVGFTPHRLRPEEFPQLATLGIGLTDLGKFHFGNDVELPRDAFDVEALRTKIRLYRPGVLAFTSKHAARAWFGHAVDYGMQADSEGTTRLFVLPSPSGQARRSWDAAHWQTLADLTR
jgi:TDG/mug DNA glycosylase family protein